MNISIIIKKDDNSSKYIVIIRKFTGKSIAEIKSAIENEKPVLKCELFKNNDCNSITLFCADRLFCAKLGQTLPVWRAAWRMMVQWWK